MNLMARMRGNTFALVGIGGVVLVILLSIVAITLNPAAPTGSPAPGSTPVPGTSAAPGTSPSPVPTPETCTPGADVLPTPTPGPTVAPSIAPTTAPIGTRKVPLAALPQTYVLKGATLGTYTATLNGTAKQAKTSFTLNATLPDEQALVATNPGSAVLSFELTVEGDISFTASSKPAGATGASLTIVYVPIEATPTPEPTATPEPTPEPNEAGPGDHCAYASVYVHIGNEGTPLDPKAEVVAKRIILFADPQAPSIDVVGVALPDGGWSLDIDSGAAWRILVDDQRVFDREAARDINQGQFCPEVAVNIVPGQATRFVFDVYRTSTVVDCPGPVALINDNLSVTPDTPLPPPPILLNPVRLGVETAQALRYRADVVAYLRSLEETNKGISPLAAFYFLIGVGGMVAFGSFAIWLLFGAHDLNATRERPANTPSRRRRWRRG